MTNPAPRRTIATRTSTPPTDACEEIQQLCLILLSGPDSGRRYQLLPGTTCLGRSRDECEVQVPEPDISRIHTSIWVGPDARVTVKDAGSTNGTQVNGQPVTGSPVELREGDKLQLGHTIKFKFCAQSPLTAELQEQMYSAAVRDRLTEVYNRAYLQDRLAKEWESMVRTGLPLSLILLDLDHFKRINDTWGHAAGDQVLRAVGGRLQRGIRADDMVARYGGEEFVILLRETGIEPALRVAERLQLALRDEPVEFEGQHLHLSASFGVSSTSETGYESEVDLLAKADERSYRAKRSGRDQVCGPGSATPSSMTTTQTSTVGSAHPTTES